MSRQAETALGVHRRVLEQWIDEKGWTREEICGETGWPESRLLRLFNRLAPLEYQDLFTVLETIDVSREAYFGEVCRELEKVEEKPWLCDSSAITGSAMSPTHSSTASLAAEHRRRGSGDAEVRALELILGSWVEAEAGLEPEAGERLLVAEHELGRFLGSRRSPGHLADLRAHQGLNAARHGRFETARASYREALGLLPEACVYARNFVTLSLAALSLALDDREAVSRYLAQAGRLAADPGFAGAADTREALREAISRLEARIH